MFEAEGLKVVTSELLYAIKDHQELYPQHPGEFFR